MNIPIAERVIYLPSPIMGSKIVEAVHELTGYSFYLTKSGKNVVVGSRSGLPWSDFDLLVIPHRFQCEINLEQEYRRIQVSSANLSGKLVGKNAMTNRLWRVNTFTILLREALLGSHLET